MEKPLNNSYGFLFYVSVRMKKRVLEVKLREYSVTSSQYIITILDLLWRYNFFSRKLKADY
ncbi:MAG: hypothetical protein JSW07_18375 [bacterium]|nr:MAG: hypothetical protein JSW07_18375 [bacterium]